MSLSRRSNCRHVSGTIRSGVATSTSGLDSDSAATVMASIATPSTTLGVPLARPVPVLEAAIDRMRLELVRERCGAWSEVV